MSEPLLIDLVISVLYNEELVFRRGEKKNFSPNDKIDLNIMHLEEENSTTLIE